MAYMDYKGMIRQDNPPQSYSPNSLSYGGIGNQSVNGAGNHSPWGGELPNAYETGFEARNYAPHVPYLQRPGTPKPPTLPGGGAQVPSTPPVNVTQPPVVPATGAGNGNPQTGGIGEINTGIKSGLLPDSVIQASIDRMKMGGAVAPNMPGMGLGPAAAGEIAANQQNVFSRGSNEQATQLGRDAAYQQSQMKLAHEKAQAAASLAGMNTLTNTYDQNASRSLRQQQMQIDLLGSLLGGLG